MAGARDFSCHINKRKCKRQGQGDRRSKESEKVNKASCYHHTVGMFAGLNEDIFYLYLYKKKSDEILLFEIDLLKFIQVSRYSNNEKF